MLIAASHLKHCELHEYICTLHNVDIIIPTSAYV